ncbi:hypothetical protein B0H34DRAFT_693505 [Crassisporium funariophilum]|nr:hypothetical protein B0H34DRAFT_693505 [Crassisporium funariophilum]
MIHMMEEDSHSSLPPSFRNLRQFPMNPGKRARSPDSESLSGSNSDRPSKRLSLATGDVSIRRDYRHLSSSSASSSRLPSEDWVQHTSEDWVQQAGGLTIDSPTVCPPNASNPFAPEEKDVDMAIDDESNMIESPVRRHPPPLQTSVYAYLTPQSQQHQQLPDSPRRHPYETRYAERTNPPMPPAINVIPATPTVAVSQHQHQHHGEEHYPSTRPSTPDRLSPTPMVMSPSSSFSQMSTPTKKRVFLGPRAGCEKCRLGIKGHFIHYE